MSSEPTLAAPAVRHPNLYANQMWRQMRFYAGALVAVGLVMTAVLAYSNQLKAGNLTWLLYTPTGLALAGLFLIYKRRSHVRALEEGVKVSNLMSSATIGYDSIRSVKVQPLNVHFQEKRKRMVAPMMKPLIDKPAIFIRVRGTDEEIAAIKKQLGSRLMHEDTVAIPVPDADAVAWEINAHLPERLGQNQGGGKRRKRRR